MQVLLINQNATIERLVKLSSGKQGYELITVHSISDVSNKEYGLIVIDGDLYNQDDFEALKQKFDTANYLLIATKGTAKPSGFDVYVEKPFLPTELLDVFLQLESAPKKQPQPKSATVAATQTAQSAPELDPFASIGGDGHTDGELDPFGDMGEFDLSASPKNEADEFETLEDYNFDEDAELDDVAIETPAEPSEEDGLEFSFDDISHENGRDDERDILFAEDEHMDDFELGEIKAKEDAEEFDFSLDDDEFREIKPSLAQDVFTDAKDEEEAITFEDEIEGEESLEFGDELGVLAQDIEFTEEGFGEEVLGEVNKPFEAQIEDDEFEELKTLTDDELGDGEFEELKTLTDYDEFEELKTLADDELGDGEFDVSDFESIDLKNADIEPQDTELESLLEYEDEYKDFEEANEFSHEEGDIFDKDDVTRLKDLLDETTDTDMDNGEFDLENVKIFNEELGSLTEESLAEVFGSAQTIKEALNDDEENGINSIGNSVKPLPDAIQSPSLAPLSPSAAISDEAKTIPAQGSQAIQLNSNQSVTLSLEALRELLNIADISINITLTKKQ